MAKISKHPDAPEGDIKVSIGTTSFRTKDDEPFETDDLALLEVVSDSYADLLVVEYDGNENAREAARNEAKALKELHKEQDRAKTQHATKDPVEPAAPVPTSVADLGEIKAQRDEKNDASKGGSN